MQMIGGRMMDVPPSLDEEAAVFFILYPPPPQRTPQQIKVWGDRWGARRATAGSSRRIQKQPRTTLESDVLVHLSFASCCIDWSFLFI
ncbi:hypothetical protein JTE90_002201 [Oedothorax gibbosus]|uniref:Uncharacterized protein n=1 Tax=Oedothorax gibbosus TaxID=931172 RepID=A0AAV6VFZ0_9ARAC|nr:hypothetical protein JTE90_002201 [Oedothorax gibbosus]